MNRLSVCTMVLAAALAPCRAQSLKDLKNIQIHGFATQAFIASSGNNYLGMDTRTGTTTWTEAAVNANEPFTDKFRAGVQLHYTRLGSFVGSSPTLDWALADYRLNPRLGLRAGKVKIRWGLFNDTQDYDPGYLWSLLPEPIYGIDIRATNLSQYGAEAYGKSTLPRKLGRLAYSGYYGYYFYSSDDGYMALFRSMGYNFPKPPSGITPGFDLRWESKIPGLLLGGSLMMYNAHGAMSTGAYSMPLAFWPTYYAQYSFRRFSTSAQYMKLVQYQTFRVSGAAPSTSGSDTRAWFAMGSYHLTGKLQAGAYYTHELIPSGGDNANPANFFKDWVASARFDFNSFFYAKLEGHFVNGNAAGLYSFNNPNGLQPKTDVALAKVGFTF